MRSSRLNRSGIIQRHRARTDSERSGEIGLKNDRGLPSGLVDPIRNLANRPISRRSLFGLTGTALVASSPLLRGARSLVSEGYQMKGNEKRLAFLVGGKERWVIDTAALGGEARLSIEEGSDKTRITLRDARLPGTDLPVDFDCLVVGAKGSRHELSFRFTELGAEGEGIFEEWLLGLKPLRMKTGVTADLLTTDNYRATLQKNAKLSFAPDWSMMAEGKSPASISGLGNTPLTSSLLLVRPFEENETPLIEGKRFRRTRISMLRDHHDWELTPDLTSGEGWDLTTPTNTFDNIEIEAAEGQRGSRRQTLLAEGDSPASFHPQSSNLTNRAGDPFALPLEHPSYALETGATKSSTLFVASYPERGAMMKGEGFAARIGQGKSEEVETFELATTAGSLDSLVCAPTIQAVTLPLKGAVVRPVRPRKQTRLWFFRTMPPEDPPGEGDGDVELDEEKEAIVTFPLDSVIWVLRPADMLYLGFEFINLKISSGGGSKGKTKGYSQNISSLKNAGNTPSINIIKAAPLSEGIGKISGPASFKTTGGGGANKPYLVVHFPPQNIAEQAFWETGDGASADQKPDNMPSAGGSETPPLPPVEHRIAGPSRLAFSLPTSITSLPYTLADLLDWSSLVQSVVPSALPPPPPPAPEISKVLGFSNELSNKIKNDAKSRKSASARLATDGKVGSKTESSLPTRSRTSANLVLKRGYIKGATSGRSASTGTTQARTAANELASSSQSIRSDHSQMGFMASENPAAKAGLYLDLKAVSPKIIKPKSHHTAIEAPYRLILSPHVYAGWAHSIEPVTHGNRTELWHTRLGVRKGSGAVDEDDSYYRTVRAVWSPDYSTIKSPDPLNTPFRMSLNGRDRHELVRLSSDFNITTPSGWVPDPVSVTSLMLSPLGAWMNVRGNWEPPDNTLSIEEWKHRGTMGRDHYVRVVYKGFLFPFGNRASLVKITERKIRKMKGGYMAYMYQRMYIVVRKPTMDYPGVSQPFDGRRTPFRSIKLTTLVTPNLDQPNVGKSKISSYGDNAFWPVVSGEDFLFNVVATDWEGKDIEFSTPLAFVNNTKAFNNDAIQNVAHPNNSWKIDRRKRELDGQTLAYAPADKEGDTDFETEYVELWYDRPTSNLSTTDDGGGVGDVPSYPLLGDSNMDMYAADQPYFYPAFHETKVRIDAVEQITGTEAFRAIQLHPSYYKHGISGSQNKGQVFAELVEAVDLSFNSNADKAGGMVTPNMGVAGLSRSLGTVGGKVEEVVKGEFDPTSFFDEALDANLLGGISLRDVVDAVGDFGGDLLKIPQMVNQKSFENPKALLSSLQSLAGAVNDVKGDIERFQEIKDDLDDAIGDIQSLPDAVTDAAKDAAETARQKALAIIKEIESEARGIVDQAKGYAESVVNKVKDIMESDSLVGLLESLGLPTEFTLELKWGPMIKSWPNSGQPNDLMGTNPLFQTLNAQGALVEKSDEVIYIRAALTVKLDGSAPTFELEGVANNFIIRLVPIKDVAPEGFVHLRMTDLSFRSKDGSKVDVNVEFDPDEGFKFAGPLAFVEKIREFIPFDGFSDPPSLDLSPTGVIAGFTFPIPTIAVGIFSLQNISLGASLELPFTNSPIVFTFLFCTRENPFILTVSMFGGGGFFGLIISTKEIGVEAALEFGANIAFDVGVASGGVYVMAGVYFKKMGEECILEGYLKLGGHLSVLGIVSISIDLYMSLTYRDPGGKVDGQATLTFEVEVFFFSVSFSKTIERRFKGSENDPLFVDLVSQDNWTEYCNAFA